MQRTVSFRNRAAAAVLAGAVAALTFEGFLRGADWLFHTRADQLPLVAGYVAATLPPGAGSATVAAVLTLAGHVAVSIGWAAGYIWAGDSSPQLLTRPVLSGAVFGLIVYIVMQVMLLTAGLYHRPTFDVLVIQLVAHAAWFGIPVAATLARQLRPAVATHRA